MTAPDVPDTALDEAARAFPAAWDSPNGAMPRDLDAERAVLGACLQGSSTVVGNVRDILPEDPFYAPRHTIIWRLICRLHDEGIPADPITVANAAVAGRERWREPDDRVFLHELYDNAPTSVTATWHADIVARHAHSRLLVEDLTRALQRVREGTDPDLIRQGLADLIRPDAISSTDVAQELDDFLGDDEKTDDYDWIVPNLIERGDRLILTGQEGKGKSTLLRQIAVQLASGIHPFTLEPITPVRVLYLDLENPPRLTRRKLRSVRLVASGRYEPTPGLYVKAKPEGIDLLHDSDARWLTALIAEHRPDVFIVGPVYKLSSGDPTEETPARTVALWLDRLRTQYGFALLIEAHSPYGMTGGGKRPERPYGASLWSRWPEFGLYLSPEGYLRHWRGARDERAWPTALQRGGEWPWSPVQDDRELLWIEIVRFCTEAGDQLAQRDLAKLTGRSQASISRAIDRHRDEWNALEVSRVEEE